MMAVQVHRFPSAIIQPPIVREMLHNHQHCVACLTSGQPQRVPGELEHHERLVAVCLVALYHMEKCR